MTTSTRFTAAFLLGAFVVGACAAEDQPAGRSNDLVPVGGGAGAGGAGASAPTTAGAGGSTGTARGGAGGDGGGAAGSEPVAGQSSGGDAGSAGVGSAGEPASGGSGGSAGGGAAGTPASGAAGASGGEAAGAGGSGGTAGVDQPWTQIDEAGCPLGRGPEMAAISVAGAPAFCVDTTEVTQAQYAAFLAKPTDVKAQKREVCLTYNHSFLPEVQKPPFGNGCPAGTYSPEAKADLPMNCVDFCDAFAFCVWSGKHLCGSVDGGPIKPAEAGVPAKSQLYAACSQGGKTKYPYGDVREAGRCDKTGQTANVLEPAKESACSGTTPPFDRVKDLVGSLDEWEDACPDLLTCSLRGGDGRSAELQKLACDGIGTTSAMIASDGIGFRCCADLPQK